jgi:hypothetical protein
MVLFAVRDINRGEKLYVDIGNEHSVKLAPYILSEDAFNSLVKTCRTWKEKSDFEKRIMVRYIVGTPYILSLLKLRGIFNENPMLWEDIASTLSLDKVKTKIRLLVFLEKIANDKKEAFAAILPTFSQQSLLLLPRFFMDPSVKIPSETQFQAIGKVVDEFIILFFGSVHGNYWVEKKQAFIELFLSDDQQDKLKVFIEKTFEKMDKQLFNDFLKYCKEQIIVSLKNAVKEACKNDQAVMKKIEAFSTNFESFMNKHPF